MQGLDHRLAEQRQAAALDVVEHIQVGDEQADHRGEVRAVPVAMDVGFASADRAARGDQAPGGTVGHMDVRLERARQITEQPADIAILHAQQPVTQVLELIQHGTAQQAAGQAHAGQRAGFDGQARAFHDGLRRVA